MPSEGIVFRDALVIDHVGRAGRNALHTDAIESQIVAGTWHAPAQGDEVTAPDGSVHQWKTIAAGNDGWFHDNALQGGYASFIVPSDREQIMLLHAQGHNLVYVNGEIRTGDPYSQGYVKLPVLLHKGENQFLFQAARGQLWAKLQKPDSPIMFNADDVTTPDLLVGEALNTWGSIVIINGSAEPATNLALQCTVADSSPTLTIIGPIPALGVRKVAFQIRGETPGAAGKISVHLAIVERSKPGAPPLDRVGLVLNAVDPKQMYKRTFISGIDGSVQYFAVQPAHPATDDGKPLGLILSLHGADVQATNQAAAYAPKTWCNIVAPTNRRPYGFDWEDWGRIDAMEVLDFATGLFKPDPQRIYLTGHSMGGHGTWQIGATYPDRFAAIAPSAGWISFWSYSGANRANSDKPIDRMLRRAANPSDTLALSHNSLHHGVYILHGDRDDNVPVEQARQMRKVLAEFHPDFVYHEQPGAGHWWGNACVDWEPLMRFLQDHAIPKDDQVDHVQFTTANPAISARSHWAVVDAQLHSMEFSTIDLQFDRNKHAVSGTTSNVARLAMSPPGVKAGDKLRVEIDGQVIEEATWAQDADALWLARRDDRWVIDAKPPATQKNQLRSGPFKVAFGHRMIFVYGTHGTEEENAWARNKARYDAETFWYRGNGSIDVVPDTEFDTIQLEHRSVILYGNADTNSAWTILLRDCPVTVHRGGIVVGDREVRGDDLETLFIRPRADDEIGCVGVVAGTGIVGMRLTDRLPYFVSGVAYPDLVILGSDTLIKGIDGIRAAGFFGNDWSVERGEIDWRN